MLKSVPPLSLFFPSRVKSGLCLIRRHGCPRKSESHDAASSPQSTASTLGRRRPIMLWRPWGESTEFDAACHLGQHLRWTKKKSRECTDTRRKAPATYDMCHSVSCSCCIQMLQRCQLTCHHKLYSDTLGSSRAFECCFSGEPKWYPCLQGSGKIYINPLTKKSYSRTSVGLRCLWLKQFDFVFIFDPTEPLTWCPQKQFVRGQVDLWANEAQTWLSLLAQVHAVSIHYHPASVIE